MGVESCPYSVVILRLRFLVPSPARLNPNFLEFKKKIQAPPPDPSPQALYHPAHPVPGT